MITVSNLSFSYPHKVLYDNVNFTIEKGQSCAFIGRSGCGKSTLASMLLDRELLIFDGDIILEDVYTMGYVSQFLDADPHSKQTVFDYIARDILALQSRIADLCTQMETATEFDALLEEYQTALDQYDAIDGEHFESNLTKMLSLAGLAGHRDLEVAKLSGGEGKLVQVIRQMLTTPHFIILDEPDSFLDFENQKALKDLINSHKGTLLTITHSRYLLNHCFDKILHLEDGALQEFEGSYQAYQLFLLAYKVDLKEQSYKCELEIERNAALVEQRRELATEVDSAAHGRALKARVSLQKRLEAERIAPPFLNIEVPEIALPMVEDMEEETLLTVTDYAVSFNMPLLENVSFTVKPGEKIALIGENGAGKTTLMRALVKGEDPAIVWSEDAKIAYLSQVHEETFGDAVDLFDACFDAGFKSYDEITETLGRFGFPAEKMTAKLSTLSGGEKTILALARLSRSDANVLLLDEPSSHLDTYAQVALEEALKAYKGAVLMISHDFYAIVNGMDGVLLMADKTVRPQRMRTFRKQIYANHFSKDYLQLEQEKQQLEARIQQVLHKNDFTTAKELLEQMDTVVQAMDEA
ncbi:ATP-binding cassette domain-containing protein [Bengtsoniella intestinalis]|uniref:ABC-F family ATP-binding cassette domain-containing protein n=1 Tax=Bengtsoniella intestinalis TaxID=3073143 RepID=UPI00391EEAB8